MIMVDSTFEIERPTRVYRKGLNLLHHDGSRESLGDNDELRAGNVDLLANEPKPPAGHQGVADPRDPSTTHPNAQEDDLKDSSTHTFYLRSSERKMRLVAKTERQQDQFIASIEKMLAKTIWAGRNRFDSFAPIRLNVAAQWLIDGVRRPPCSFFFPLAGADDAIASATISGASRARSPSPSTRSSAWSPPPSSPLAARTHPPPPSPQHPRLVALARVVPPPPRHQERCVLARLCCVVVAVAVGSS